MKAHLSNFILVCIVLSFHLTFAGEDEFIENIYTPTDNSQSSPVSIAYNDINNMFYVYTGHKVIVVNKSTGLIEDAITVGQTGYFYPHSAAINKTHKLVFDQSRNYVYCANEDDELIVINCSDNSILDEIPAFDLVKRSFLYYNSNLDILYWIQSEPISSANSRLYAFNPSDLANPLGSFEPVGDIKDLVFCINDAYIALSVASGSNNGSLYLINSLDLSFYDQIQLYPRVPGKLLCIEELNRVYCLTTGSSGNILETYTINQETSLFIHLSYFSISDFPLNRSQSACYSTSSNYAYFAGSIGNNCGLIIIDYNEPNNGSPIAAQYNIPNALQVVHDATLDHVYCAGDALKKISGTEIEGTASIQGTANHLILADGSIVLTNIDGNTVNWYNTDLTLSDRVLLGDHVLKGCLNQNGDKIYWISHWSKNPESFVTIQNLTDGSIVPITIGAGIRDMSYNGNADKLVVANWYYTNPHLTLIDGMTNQVEEITSSKYNHVQAGEGCITYLGGGNCLDYLNMTNNNINPIQHNLTAPYEIIDLDILNNGDCIALAVEDQSYGWCKILKIDHVTSQIAGTYPFQLIPAYRNGLDYNELKDQIYINSVYSLTIIDPFDFSTIGSIAPSNCINNFLFASRNDNIIIHEKYGSNRKVLFYDATSLELENEINFDPYDKLISFAYNPINDLLYMHILSYNPILANEIKLYSYRCSNLEMNSEIYLEQNNIKGEFIWFLGEQMVFDEDYKHLYIPNQYLGDISIVQCSSDQLPLSGYYSWISFPRLERDAAQNLFVHAENVLNDHIKPGPDNQYTGWMQYLDYDETFPGNEHMIDIRKPSTFAQWDPNSGYLKFVSSTQGYQIHLAPEQQYIELAGFVQDPSVEVDIHGDFENWTGYFLPYPQHPVNAIPTSVLDNLTRMAGQYWQCYNEAPYPDGSGGVWRCACSEGKVEIKYGDMIKLFSDDDASFNWQQITSSPSGIDKPRAELFSYEEQANYEAYFLELDSTDLPDEIGAMVNDTCIGATKVFPGEDTVLICAYTEGYEGEEVTFQFAYSTKSVSSRINDYFVLNSRTGIKEQRRIKIGEGQPYYFISLKNSMDGLSSLESVRMRCHPNPASHDVTVKYFLDIPAEVNFYLTNTMGSTISSWNIGTKRPGEYQFKFSTEGVPDGYFLMRMTAGNHAIIDKICIIH